MKTATQRWLVLLALAFASPTAFAQSLGDEFILFVDGVNVLIPQLSQGDVVGDPLDPTSGNRVARFNGGNWTEGGFAWSPDGTEMEGVDATANVGAAVGEGDTLFFRMLSDPANAGQGGVGIMISDATDGSAAQRADIEAGTASADFKSRLVWTIPPELHDGQWHDLALPLPPSTIEALEAARAAGELDDVTAGWAYTGAWSNGGYGVGVVGGFDPSNTDPIYQAFEWDRVLRIGPFWDNNTGQGPIYMDDVYIGGPSTDISAASNPPPAMSGVSFAANGLVNTISWSDIDGAFGYNVYISEEPITDVRADGVALLERVGLDAPRTVDDRQEISHPSQGAPTVYYAVTSLSQFGVENPDVSASAGSVANGDLAQRAYIRGLTMAEADALFDDVSNGTVSDENFPDDQPVFVVDTSHRTIIEGTVVPTDEDVSGRFMIGYTDLEEWFVYGEIMDDVTTFAPEGESGGNTWQFDSAELAFGHYDVRDIDGGSLLFGSPHQDMQRGAEPDYQIRITGRQNPAGDIIGSSTWIGFSRDEEVPNNPTTVERTATGWKFLTLLPMDAIQNVAQGDVLLPVPGDTEIQYIPFTISINDNDTFGTNIRESQILLSVKSNVTNQWWNTPAQYEVIAIAGRNASVVSNERELEDDGYALGQSTPNPVAGVASIDFALGAAAHVQIEVYNALGQRVAVVADRAMPAGEQSVTFDTSALAPGVYVYRLAADDYVATRRMTVVR